MLLMTMAGLALIPTVTVESRTVRVGDLVGWASGRRLAGLAARTIALRLPVGVDRVVLPAPAVAALLQRRGAIWVAAAAGTITIAIRRTRPWREACWSSRRALNVGEAVTTADVTRVRCTGGLPRAVAYHANTGAVVLHDAPAGTALGRLMPGAAGQIAPGASLVLRSRVGHVVVERPVTAIQQGRSGRGVFVRDADGHILSARLAPGGGVR